MKKNTRSQSMRISRVPPPPIITTFDDDNNNHTSNDTWRQLMKTKRKKSLPTLQTPSTFRLNVASCSPAHWDDEWDEVSSYESEGSSRDDQEEDENPAENNECDNIVAPFTTKECLPSPDKCLELLHEAASHLQSLIKCIDTYHMEPNPEEMALVEQAKAFQRHLHCQLHSPTDETDAAPSNQNPSPQKRMQPHKSLSVLTLEEDTEALDVLVSIPLFQSLSDNQRQHLQYIRKTYTKDESIIRQFDVGHTVFVLLEGQVSIWQQNDENDEGNGRLIDVLDAPGVFGERALLQNGIQSASVRAESSIVRCLALHRDQFSDLVQDIRHLQNGFLPTPRQWEDTKALRHHLERFVNATDELESTLQAAISPEFATEDVLKLQLQLLQAHLDAAQVDFFRWNDETHSFDLEVSTLDGEINVLIPEAVKLGQTIRENASLWLPKWNTTHEHVIGVIRVVNITKPVDKRALEHVTASLHVSKMPCLWSCDLLKQSFALRVVRLTLPRSFVTNASRVMVTMRLFHGDQLLPFASVSISTTKLQLLPSGSWEFQFDESNDVLCGAASIAQLPMGTRIVLEFTIGNSSLRRRLSARGSEFPSETSSDDGNGVGFACFYLYAQDNRMQHGDLHLNACMNKRFDPLLKDGDHDSCCQLHVRMPRFAKPVVYGPLKKPSEQVTDPAPTDVQLLHVFSNPFHVLSTEETDAIWRQRRALMQNPKALPSFLLSVKWQEPEMVQEAYVHMTQWTQLTTEQAIQLLGPQFPDPRVRAFAVKTLEYHADPTSVSLLMLQLVQALRFERHVDSALSRFLLRQAIRHPLTSGHALYWSLRAEVDGNERFGVLLDVLVRFVGPNLRQSLRHQVVFMDQLLFVHHQLKPKATMEEKNALLRQHLQEFKFPARFALPLDVTKHLSGLVVDKCRVLSSKQKPLYLVFLTVENDEFHVLYKHGDDLRQDQFILQLFQVMNGIWKRQNLPLALRSYNCLAISHQSGLIEVVRRAETIGTIVSQSTEAQHGSSRGTPRHKLQSALGIFREENTLAKWLFQHHTHGNIGHIIDRFARSCAASCVATYVLGIGDRHNDNIMLSVDGTLFHIDFGHILGNFKTKFGVKRERVKFVFTPAFASILWTEESEPTHAVRRRSLRTASSKSLLVPPRPMAIQRSKSSPSEEEEPEEKRHWLRTMSFRSNALGRRASESTVDSIPTPAPFLLFTQLACDAFNALRQDATLLYSLCLLMTSSDLPELQSAQDLRWLHKHLVLDVSEDGAAFRFQKLIRKSLKSNATLWNDAAHMLKHA